MLLSHVRSSFNKCFCVVKTILPKPEGHAPLSIKKDSRIVVVIRGYSVFTAMSVHNARKYEDTAKITCP